MNHLIKRNNKIVKVHNNIIIPNIDVVKIGNQYWTAKNLAIYDGGSGIYIKSNVTANGVNFGDQYYYSYAAAVRVANSIPGWHLPTDNDFTTLVSYIGGNNKAYKLKSTTGWDDGKNGTDEFGFNALPTGYLIGTGLYNSGRRLNMRCADGENYIAYITDDNFFDHYSSTVYDNSFKFSIRLVKD